MVGSVTRIDMAIGAIVVPITKENQMVGTNQPVSSEIDQLRQQLSDAVASRDVWRNNCLQLRQAAQAVKVALLENILHVTEQNVDLTVERDNLLLRVGECVDLKDKSILKESLWSWRKVGNAEIVCAANLEGLSAKRIAYAHNETLIKLVRAAQACDKMLWVMRAYIKMHGVQHDEEGCPQDDTCQCQIIAGINEAMTDLCAVLVENAVWTQVGTNEEKTSNPERVEPPGPDRLP
jgi:hypothetical protein